MAIRTQAQIANDMATWLQSRLRIVDTSQNTVVYALLLQGLGTALGNAYAALQTAEQAQGIGFTSTTATSDLDDIAYNLNMTRKGASSSAGFITFRTATQPSVTVRIGAVDGTGGIEVGTPSDANGANVSFLTTQTVFLTPTTPQNPVTGFYEVSASISAVQPGSVGNQQAGIINTILTAVQGVTSCTNTVATTGGEDTESNAEFAIRLSSKILGFQPGISEGLRTIALSQPGAIDSAIVGPDDSYFEQSTIGAVDVVVYGSALATATDTINFSVVPYVMANRPVVSVQSVVSTVGLTFGSLTPGIQYVFSQDLVSNQQLSVQSNDQISFLGTNLPANGALTTINYTYDSLIGAVQGILNQPNSHYPSAFPLVKRATLVYLTIAFSITRSGTVSATVLSNNINTAIDNYIASLGLGNGAGALVSQSNLTTVIKSVSGIKNLILPFTTLAIQGQSGTADIQLNKYSVPALNAQSVIVTFTN